MSIKQYIFITLLIFSPTLKATRSTHAFTVVLDPGTQNNTVLMQEAIKCVETVRQTLEDTFPQIRVVLSRTSLEAAEPLQTASFSNRIEADLHIVFNFFIEKESTKSIRLYTCGKPNSKVFKNVQKPKLAFTPANKVYETHKEQSEKLAQNFVAKTKKLGSIPIFEVTSLPLLPLQSVSAPSFLLELSMAKPKDWKSYFVHLCEGFTEIIAIALASKKQPESLTNNV